MKNNYDLLWSKVFGVDIAKTPAEIVDDLTAELTEEKEFKVEICENNKAITLNYKLQDNKITALCTAAGLPNENYLQAINVYKQEVEEHGADYSYNLEGSKLGGALAKYAAVMARGCVEEQQVFTYDSFGLENFLEFKGNEFIGYQWGLLYYLDNIFCEDKRINQILYGLNDEGVIKYGTISKQFRKLDKEKIKSEEIKQVVKKILKERLGLEEEESEKLVEENFNSKLIESKMNFIDSYREYENLSQDKKNRINNYIFANNLVARLFKHIGPTYLVDRGLKKDDNLEQDLVNLVNDLEEEQIEQLIESSPELFEPYTLLEAEGNGREAVNRFGNPAEIGEITNNLSKDYLRALVKDIILDLHNADETILTEIFKSQQRRGPQGLIKLIKDRLQHSMYLRGLKQEEELDYQSRLLEEKPELFAEVEKNYRLDRAVIEQLEERMSYFELKNLCQWKLSGEGIFIILGSDVEGDEVIEYHSSTQAFDNSREEIAIELEEASRNKIYGSLKKSANYKEESDKHYHHQEDEAYNFSSQQGVGFFIVDDQVDPQKSVKVDGTDISGVYEEIQREEAELGEREVSTRDKYFGEDIILRDAKKTMES